MKHHLAPGDPVSKAPTDTPTMFSPAQREAIEHNTGPMLVLAGAGSGKTATLTERIAHLLATGHAYPTELLAVTFTQDAAKEMRDRLKARVGAALASEVTDLGTFHSLCGRILRTHASEIGRSSNFSICDQRTAVTIIERHLSTAATVLLGGPQETQRKISACKNKGISLNTYPGHATAGRVRPQEHEALLAAWSGYEAELERSDALDFDDLLAATLHLLSNPALKAAYQARWKYVHVDEFQDVNGAQHQLLTMLAEGHRNLFAVGDDDQAVYAWRGSEVRRILAFTSQYPDATVVRLQTNYRSSPAIVAAANRLIGHNQSRYDKRMRSCWTDEQHMFKRCAPVIVRGHPTEQQEARWVATQISRALSKHIDPQQIAVLGRSRHTLETIESALTQAAIPVRWLQGEGFHERKAVRVALAHLTILANPHDQDALMLILEEARDHIGPKTCGTLIANAEARGLNMLDACQACHEIDGLPARVVTSLTAFGETMSGLQLARRKGQINVSDLLYAATHMAQGYVDVLKRRGNIQELGHVDELIGDVRRYENTEPCASVGDYLSKARLAAGSAPAGHQQRVTLGTVHRAKGLEWDLVIVAGLEEGRFPSRHSATSEQIEEERRLAYVAFTRARTTLALSHVHKRAGRSCTPSRFIYEATST